MIRPNEPTTSQSIWRFPVEQGLDVLDAWSQTASQAHRNAMYEVLFAVQDGSVFRRYLTVDDASAQGFSVYVHLDLIIRVRLEDEAFTISYIGSADSAPR